MRRELFIADPWKKPEKTPGAGGAFREFLRETLEGLRYVVIDTQSDPASPSCPSTEKQKDLGRLLAAAPTISS